MTIFTFVLSESDFIKLVIACITTFIAVYILTIHWFALIVFPIMAISTCLAIIIILQCLTIPREALALRVHDLATIFALLTSSIII